MKVLALPGSMPGSGTCDYRIVYPLRHLKRQFGIKYEISPSVDLGKLAKFDLVVFQRQEMAIIQQAIHAAHKVGVKAIFDLDDDAIHVPFHNPNFLMWGKDHTKIAEITRRLAVANEGQLPEYLRRPPKEVAKQARANLYNLLDNIAAANALTVSTPWLSEVYSKKQRRRYVLPNWAEPEEWEGIDYEPHEGVILGWAGGPTHFDDLRVIAGPIKQIMEEYPQTKLVLAGYPAVKQFLFGQIPEDRVITHPFGSEWRKNLSTFDIVLAPSADNKFNRGKSAIRVYQGLLATRGKAAVVGSETTYGDTIRRLKCGFVCKNTGDWLRSLPRLIENGDLRRQMGQGGYEKTMEEETYSANAWRWMKCYEEVLSVR